MMARAQHEREQGEQSGFASCEPKLALKIDTHAHLHVKAFDADREAVIKRAFRSGVTKIVNVGFDIEENFKALALAKKYEFIYATMGVHPHLASQWNEQVGRKIFDTAKKEEKIVAIGETGLDYFKNFQPAELQKKVFGEQLRIAKALDLPVIVHCRDAFDDAIKILEDEKIEQCVFHCFTGNNREADTAIRQGYYLGFTGIITYSSAAILREILKKAPQDKILFETDCPYLAPQKFRGERNEPAHVSDIYKFAASLRKSDFADFERQIFCNAASFFSL